MLKLNCFNLILHFLNVGTFKSDLLLMSINIKKDSLLICIFQQTFNTFNIQEAVTKSLGSLNEATLKNILMELFFKCP